MPVDRDAAAVVANLQGTVFVQPNLDARCVTGDRFVNGIVDDFGREMVQGADIATADIHAGVAPNRLQPFQNVDVRGVVAGRCRNSLACGLLAAHEHAWLLLLDAP